MYIRTRRKIQSLHGMFSVFKWSYFSPFLQYSYKNYFEVRIHSMLSECENSKNTVFPRSLMLVLFKGAYNRGGHYSREGVY